MCVAGRRGCGCGGEGAGERARDAHLRICAQSIRAAIREDLLRVRARVRIGVRVRVWGRVRSRVRYRSRCAASREHR